MRRSERRVHAVELPALPQRLIVDLARTALIVIDMQNDFCAPDGWMASLGVDVSAARALAHPINLVTAAMRAKGVPIIWLNWGVRADRLNLSPGTHHPFNPTGRGAGLSGELTGVKRTHHLLRQGGWGAQIIEELVQDSTDIRVDKHRISGFWDTPLEAILRNQDVTTLMFAGINADHCVLGTLMDANFHGFDTILLEDCTATTSPDFCLQATLHNVRFCFGFTTTSRQLVDCVSDR
ncbi:MAG TPA: isochorismatase family cysteine hydrolase [Steroidobacteraceae bacterium]|nr:isochorismatase family cysteine hydrolase [Steroidobacteraceae bacterium]